MRCLRYTIDLLQCDVLNPCLSPLDIWSHMGFVVVLGNLENLHAWRSLQVEFVLWIQRCGDQCVNLEDWVGRVIASIVLEEYIRVLFQNKGIVSYFMHQINGWPLIFHHAWRKPINIKYLAFVNKGTWELIGSSRPIGTSESFKTKRKDRRWGDFLLKNLMDHHSSFVNFGNTNWMEIKITFLKNDLKEIINMSLSQYLQIRKINKLMVPCFLERKYVIIVLMKSFGWFDC